MANTTDRQDQFPHGSTAPNHGPLLEIENLSLDLENEDRHLRALEDVSLSVDPGETLCLVGESGSGKSLTALSIGQLLPSPPARYRSGRILLQGRDVLTMSRQELQAVRGGVVSYIFQEPGASLNPVFRVGRQIMESLRLHSPDAAHQEEVIRLLKEVGIPAPESRMRDYPHQLSGGMQQRIMIAMALASRPQLLVADEPTTALDVTIQAQIMELLAELKQRLDMSILLITHNLGIVAEVADHVAVMYAGSIVESAPTAELLQNPLHPYTRALLESVPEMGARQERLKTIPGTVPSLDSWPSGCRFHPRCPLRKPECSQSHPSLQQPSDSHYVRCPVVTDTKGKAIP